ncbi:MAG: GNAT family N-acetyltransferase [Oscillospiraceae bacterium]|nr:GNAT family N-acetyltransferase [Oscillospiraceae bacterium]
MGLEFKYYDKLPAEAAEIRKSIFLVEQKFSVEFDETDGFAVHIVGYIGAEPVCVCRVFYNEEKQSHIIGRVAVVKEYRRRGIGKLVVNEAERYLRSLGAKRIMLSAQERVSDFYAGCGFERTDSKYYDEYCPHVWMKKEIE